MLLEWILVWYEMFKPQLVKAEHKTSSVSIEDVQQSYELKQKIAHHSWIELSVNPDQAHFPAIWVCVF